MKQSQPNTHTGHQNELINLSNSGFIFNQQCVCHLTLTYDGVPLEELLHHDLLALTGNLQSESTVTTWRGTFLPPNF